MITENPTQPKLTKTLLWLMTLGAGLTVANIYYNQPLLGKIARDFHVTESVANNVAMVTQVGYALGLFLLTPLGDMLKRGPVIFFDFLVLIISLLVFAFSKTIEVAMVSTFFIGLCSVAPQMFIPVVAQLSKPEEKNKNIGIVISGLLVGILASRVFSGLIGQYWGWREMYYLAAGIIFILGIAVLKELPSLEPPFKGSYKQLMTSLIYYFKNEPKLRLISFESALCFGSFLAFWTTLTFHLEKAPFFAGSDVAGSLGLVGVGGALAATVVGKLSNRVPLNTLFIFGFLSMTLSWVVLGIWGFTYVGIILGILFLDVGLQTVQVTSQTIVYSLNEKATNRLNTIYMTSYFIGGSCGTFLGGKAWTHFGWYGVVGTGMCFILICYITHFFSVWRERQHPHKTLQDQ